MSTRNVAFIVLIALGAPASGEWEPYSFGRVRGDYVTDLPGGRDDVERARLHGFFGARYFTGSWEFGAAAKVSLGTESNSVNVANLDNEEEDSLDIGEFYARYATDTAVFEAGRSPLPFTLSALVWDHDLRPAGVSYQYDKEVGEFSRLSVLGGYFAPLHIDESESRLGGLQVRFDAAAGDPTGWRLAFGYFEFTDLEEVVADGRTRTNRRNPSGLISDYELAVASFGTGWMVGERPLVLDLEIAKNLGADDLDEAARLSLKWGDVRDQPWEAGYSIQRIQRDAVQAAFNEDDWWFPTNVRGYSAWYGHRLTDHWSLKVSGFVERRDDLDNHLKRLLIDLNWNY